MDVYLLISTFNAVVILIYFLCGGGRKQQPRIEYGNVRVYGECHAGEDVIYPMQEGCKLKVEIDCNLQVKCPRKVVAMSSGPTVAGIVPRYPYMCVHDQVAGISARVTYDRKKKYGISANQQTVRMFQEFWVRNHCSFFGVQEQKCVRIPWTKWLSNYAGKKLRQYQLALQRFRIGQKPRNFCKMSIFLKWEESLKALGKAFYPRIIGAQKPFQNICEGQLCKTFSEIVYSIWNPKPTDCPYLFKQWNVPNLLYATKRTRTQLGRAFDQLAAMVKTRAGEKQVVQLSSDLSGYDSTISEPLLRLQRYSLVRLFKTTSLERDALVTGMQSFGTTMDKNVTFKAPPMLHTGSHGTSVWNTTLRMISAVYSVLKTKSMIRRIREIAKKDGISLQHLRRLGIPVYEDEASDGTPHDGLRRVDEELVDRHIELVTSGEHISSKDTTLQKILCQLPLAIAALGDDNVIMLPLDTAIEMKNSTILSELGFKEKVEMGDLAKTDFLSAHMISAKVNGVTQSVLTGKIGRLFTKMFYIRKLNMCERKRVKYCVSIAYAMLQDFNHIKFFKIWAENIIQQYKRVEIDIEWASSLKARSVKWDWEEPLMDDQDIDAFYAPFKKPKQHDPKPEECVETRRQLCEIYKITDQDLRDLEAYMANVQRYNAILDHPILDHIVRCDLKLTSQQILGHEGVAYEYQRVS